MDINDLRSIVTVVSLLTFLAIVFWAYGLKSNKKRFEEADWHGQQTAQRARIEFYDLRVDEAVERLDLLARQHDRAHR